MTDSFPVDAIAGGDGLRRDRYGRLLVVPPGSSKVEGYTRVTTVAKATDDGGGLMPWKATAAVIGTLRQRGIRAQWETLMAEHRDPWYATPDSKAKCKFLVEEAANVGGASDRREQGVSLHAITAQVDRGEHPEFLSAEVQADIEAYVSTLAGYGIQAYPEHVETTVVLDYFKVGGTFDRLVKVDGREFPMIADLKTGADLSYSWGSFAVQLAAYAHGDAIYKQGPTPDDDVRLPMPEVDLDEALVIWLPAGEGRCELFTVDIALGWEGFNLSMEVRGWRSNARNLAAPLSQWQPPIVSPQASYQARLREWLQTRINVCGNHSPECRAELGRAWPEGMPTLNASTDHTDADLIVIETVLNRIEARYSVPFGASRPVDPDEDRAATARILNIFPNAEVVGELPTN